MNGVSKSNQTGGFERGFAMADVEDKIPGI